MLFICKAVFFVLATGSRYANFFINRKLKCLSVGPTEKNTCSTDMRPQHRPPVPKHHNLVSAALNVKDTGSKLAVQLLARLSRPSRSNQTVIASLANSQVDYNDQFQHQLFYFKNVKISNPSCAEQNSNFIQTTQLIARMSSQAVQLGRLARL